MYLKNSSGEKSLTATISIVAFFIVMLKVLVSGATLTIGTFNYVFGDIDSAEITALLGTTLGVYAFRRHTDAKFPDGTSSGEKSPE